MHFGYLAWSGLQKEVSLPMRDSEDYQSNLCKHTFLSELWVTGIG